MFSSIFSAPVDHQDVNENLAWELGYDIKLMTTPRQSVRNLARHDTSHNELAEKRKFDVIRLFS